MLRTFPRLEGPIPGSLQTHCFISGMLPVHGPCESLSILYASARVNGCSIGRDIRCIPQRS